VVLENESRETFDILMSQHLDRLQPVDGVELGFVEEMVASHWRLRRAWALETSLIESQIALQPGPQSGDDPAVAEIDRMANAFKGLAESRCISLMHRYETRLHVMYQRALHNLLLLRAAGPPNPEVQNEPNPISGHSGEILQLPHAQ
jgi:hypothetical protein